METPSTSITIEEDTAVTIELSQAAPVSLIKMSVSTESPGQQLKMLAFTDAGIAAESDVFVVESGDHEIHLLPRGTCNGAGTCLPPAGIDCDAVVDAGQGGELCDSSQDEGDLYCQFFVPNIGFKRSCNEVCEASGMRCLEARSDTDDDCRTRDRESCSDRMNDFVCKCGPTD